MIITDILQPLTPPIPVVLDGGNASISTDEFERIIILFDQFDENNWPSAN